MHFSTCTDDLKRHTHQQELLPTNGTQVWRDLGFYNIHVLFWSLKTKTVIRVITHMGSLEFCPGNKRDKEELIIQV